LALDKSFIFFKKRLNSEGTIVRLFILGSSIYVGTYIFFSNVDYRLVFLFLTIPYMCEKKNINSVIFTVCVLISSFSWYFSVGHPLSLIYAINAIIVYSAKLILFLLLSYELGTINNNFFKNIFFLNKNKSKTY